MPTAPSPPKPAPALPERLALPPHWSVLPLGPDARLLGLDPGSAIAVEGLSGGLAAMLDELRVPAGSVGLLARALERGVEAEQAIELLRRLVEAGALVDAAVAERGVRLRRDSVVVVTGEGPIAVGVVVGLVRAGVGTVYTETGGAVLAGDLGTGFLDADRGRDRSGATRDAVRRLCPQADAAALPLRAIPDLVVLTDALAPEPARIARLHTDLTPHLPVRLRDGVGVIGPLVLPGRSACLGCLELHRRSRAPEWPRVSAQLSGRAGRAGPAETAATAALAAAQVLTCVDAVVGGGDPPPTLQTSIEFDAAAGTIVRRPWTPHPDCGCGSAQAARAASGGLRHGAVTSADRGGRETIMV